jgi:hypothetical protein
VFKYLDEALSFDEDYVTPPALCKLVNFKLSKLPFNGHGFYPFNFDALVHTSLTEAGAEKLPGALTAEL